MICVGARFVAAITRSGSAPNQDLCRVAQNVVEVHDDASFVLTGPSLIAPAREVIVIRTK